MKISDPNIKLRPVVDDDQAFLYNVYASTRQDEIAMFGWDEVQQEAFLRMQFNGRRMAYKMQFPTAEHSVVLKGEVPVGQMIVDRTPTHIVLTDIAVLPEFRGGGIGAMLVSALKNEAAGAGLPLILRVDKGNVGALKFYERLGFAATDETELLYELRWLPAAP